MTSHTIPKTRISNTSEKAIETSEHDQNYSVHIELLEKKEDLYVKDSSEFKCHRSRSPITGRGKGINVLSPKIINGNNFSNKDLSRAMTPPKCPAPKTLAFKDITISSSYKSKHNRRRETVDSSVQRKRSTSPAVFERLSKSSTVASNNMKWSESRDSRSNSAPPRFPFPSSHGGLYGRKTMGKEIQFSHPSSPTHRNSRQIIRAEQERRKSSANEQFSRQISTKVGKSRQNDRSQSPFDRLAKTETVASVNMKWNSKRRSSSSIKLRYSSPPVIRFDQFAPSSLGEKKTQQRSKERQVKIPKEEDNKPLGNKIGRNLTRSAVRLFVETETNENQISQSNLPTRQESEERKQKKESRSFRRKRNLSNIPVLPDNLSESVTTASREPPDLVVFSSRIKLLCKYKNIPECGFSELDRHELGLLGSLAVFESDSDVLTCQEMASEIVCALFWKDLPQNKQWTMYYPKEKESSLPNGEVGEAYFVEVYASSRDKINSTASASGNVILYHEKDEIRVDNYLCIVNGDEKRRE